MNTTANKLTDCDASRVYLRACEEAARLFWGDSMDDYAAAILSIAPDGAVKVTQCDGRSTWHALLNACGQDRDKASVFADMRTAENWTPETTREGVVHVRAIWDADDNVAAYLFRR